MGALFLLSCSAANSLLECASHIVLGIKISFGWYRSSLEKLWE